jgi:glycerol-3-phosphate O-acyltransferase
MILFLLKLYLNNTNFFKFVYPIIIGVGVLIGHIFPIFFKFKGGKGVATFFGIIFAFNILLFITFLAIYLSLLLITKIVSISSVLSATTTSLLSLINIFYIDVFGFMQINTA